MKKYLYFLVPPLKWLVNLTVIMLTYNYVFPEITNKWLSLGLGWTLSALVAAPFAYWAFHRQLPTDRQLGIFIGTWLVISLIMDLLVSLMSYSESWTMIFRYEFIVQYLLEILVILVLHRVRKRHNAYHLAAEGIEL